MGALIEAASLSGRGASGQSGVVQSGEEREADQHPFGAEKPGGGLTPGLHVGRGEDRVTCLAQFLLPGGDGLRRCEFKLEPGLRNRQM